MNILSFLKIDYELIAYSARYLFLILTVAILLALILVSYREYRDKKDIKSVISAYLGYLEIIDGPKDFLGDQFGVAADNIIGSSSESDIIVEGAGLALKHARLISCGESFYIDPVAGADVYVNGAKIQTRRTVKTGDVIVYCQHYTGR